MRDDFTARTKDILAKRVGYRCSNIDCRKLTVGPSSDINKAINLGVAAHITAASPGGPRYDEDLTPDQRIAVDNGIWLCVDCSTLIDRDAARFTVQTLKQWKSLAENESLLELTQTNKNNQKRNKKPILEAEIIWTSTMRTSVGWSAKNRIYKEAIPVGQVYYDYKVTWNYNLIIYNTSTIPAFNLKVFKDPTGKDFSYIEPIRAKNNIQPYGDLTIEVSFVNYFTGIGSEVEEHTKDKFPTGIQDLTILLAYLDEDRTSYFTELILKGSVLDNFLLQTAPNKYNI